MLVFRHVCVVTCEEKTTEHWSILIVGTKWKRITGNFRGFYSGTLDAERSSMNVPAITFFI
jgi:hypothetical protein